MRDARWAFGPYSICPAERVLRHDGRPVAIASKALDLLAVLASDPGRVFDKRRLLDRVWPAGFVEESNLTQTVYVLRRLFESHGAGVTIENVRKRGYRLVVAQTPAPQTLDRRTPFGAGIAVFAAALACAAYFAWPRPVASPAPLPLAAEQAYLLGRRYQAVATPAMLERSAAQFAQTIRRAPLSALGYAGLAEADASLAFYADDPARLASLQAQALTLARRAVATDATSAEAYAALGGVELNIEHDTAAAGRALGEALRRDPNEVSALLWNGARCLDDGDTSSARHMFARAVAIAPNTAGAVGSLAWAEFVAGDMSRAAALSRQMLAAHQSPTLALQTLADASLADRDLRTARTAIARLQRDPNSALAANAMAARLDLLAGDRAAAAMRLGRIETATDPSQVGSWDAAEIAAAYVAMGDRPRAYLWLERVRLWERGGVARDPRFARLRSDPAFSRWVNG